MQSNKNMKKTLDIKMTESEQKESFTTLGSDKPSADNNKKGKKLGTSQDAKMNITESELKRRIKPDHFQGEGGQKGMTIDNEAINFYLIRNASII